jgi:acyl-CoA reductase-like NAD-dependent aldehyde dehydrogenase
MYLQTIDGESVVPCVIDGKPVVLPSTQNFPVIQSSTGSTVHYAQSATVEVALQAADSAWHAFQSWKRSTVDTRRDILLRAADILQRRSEEAQKRNISETSAPTTWTFWDVVYAAKQVREAASCVTTAVHGSIPMHSNPEITSLVFKEAIGPVLMIPPWNAALILSFRSIAHIIAAGCTVVLKASEACPFTHQIILEVLEEAGLPSGVVNQIHCARKDAGAVTEALIAHQGIRKVEFIGSAAVGKIIGGLAAKYLKPILMELGDQSPCIILEDADLKAAAAVAAEAGEFVSKSTERPASNHSSAPVPNRNPPTNSSPS